MKNSEFATGPNEDFNLNLRKLVATNVESVEFPAGIYLITDLCYVYPEDEWIDFCELDFRESGRGYSYNGAVFVYNNINFFVSNTAYGDGIYPIKRNNKIIGHCGVDSGCLALIPIELVRIWLNNSKKSINNELSVLVNIVKNFTINSGGGDWNFDNIEVITSDDRGEKNIVNNDEIE